MSIKCQKSFTLTVNTQPPKLISYWTLDQTLHTTRLDSKGVNDLPAGGAFVGNGVTSIVGKISNALSFSSGGQGCEKDDSALGSLARGFTVCGWSKVPASFCLNQTFNFFNTDFSFSIQLGQTGGGGAMSLGGSFGGNINSAAAGNAFVFFRAWADPVTGKYNLQVNDGAIVSANMSGAALPSSSNGHIYMASSGAFAANMGVDEVGFWQGVLLDADASYIYNGGTGRTYPDLPYV